MRKTRKQASRQIKSNKEGAVEIGGGERGEVRFSEGEKARQEGRGIEGREECGSKGEYSLEVEELE